MACASIFLLIQHFLSLSHFHISKHLHDILPRACPIKKFTGKVQNNKRPKGFMFHCNVCWCLIQEHLLNCCLKRVNWENFTPVISKALRHCTLTMKFHTWQQIVLTSYQCSCLLNNFPSSQYYRPLNSTMT